MSGISNPFEHVRPFQEDAVDQRPGPAAMQPNITAQLCKALSIPARVQIVNLLIDRKRLHMGAIAEAVGIEPSLATHHVDMLERAGLVRRVKQRATGVGFIDVELVVDGNVEVFGQVHAAFRAQRA